MALISVIAYPEGEDYDQATRLMQYVNEGVGPGYEKAVLNNTKMVDLDGRAWFGYTYDSNSWWVTRVSRATHPYNLRYEFHEQHEPRINA